MCEKHLKRKKYGTEFGSPSGEGWWGSSQDCWDVGTQGQLAQNETGETAGARSSMALGDMLRIQVKKVLRRQNWCNLG